ncbi:MAG: RHS repeat-associated core domain-containing protein, partial [Blastocatellia bacterium]|nr:RHS repeat-associated core domain-containing protein [Blastocatellia bacterium]
MYDAYGRPSALSAVGNPYLFTARRYDPETGFYYYRTRYYDPLVGRFITRDTIGMWGDETEFGNGYSYVGNAPVSLTDPFGLAKTLISSNSNSDNCICAGGAGDTPGPLFVTTVKSIKSNSDNRIGVGGAGDTPGPLFVTTVRSTKSNSDNRIGVGGAGDTPGPLFVTTVKS